MTSAAAVNIHTVKKLVEGSYPELCTALRALYNADQALDSVVSKFIKISDISHLHHLLLSGSRFSHYTDYCRDLAGAYEQVAARLLKPVQSQLELFSNHHETSEESILRNVLAEHPDLCNIVLLHARALRRLSNFFVNTSRSSVESSVEA